MDPSPDDDGPRAGTGATHADDARRRLRVRVEGAVQGVGFRPYVYRLARELDLAGFVRNDARGVLLEVEGAGPEVARFLERLPGEAPPLARVDRVLPREMTPTGQAGFRIAPSAGGERTEALVAPDTATCPDCLAELFDPEDRRYRYPFINCTNCGPRFTIVCGVPYDRSRTTMAGFEMCAACRAEYGDPGDRRFHAQPNACPACGPAARLVDAAGAAAERPRAGDPVEAAARALLGGAIVAVKGLGGFHLACRADGEEVVARLRDRKHREAKPFAVMAPDVEAAARLAELGPEERELLTGIEGPIVLARRRPGAPVAGAVAPGHRDLGIMLPYSPLHHLLLRDAGTPLVMTSGNVSEEPIAYRDADALQRLGGIAELFLIHDRPIETRTDDSVVRVVSVGGERRPAVLRRSRGYVPAPLPLPVAPRRPLLACGAHLKNTFTLARGERAWVGHHIGDLENWETLRSFEEGVAHLERIFEVSPEVLVHDLHPDYLSTRYAAERAAADGSPLVGVQHHHAHLAACLAEHGERGPALGAIFDGTGYGPDGTVWGGELLLGDLADAERVGHLWPVRMPGGEAAVREPWRMALSWMLEASRREADVPRPAPSAEGLAREPPEERRSIPEPPRTLVGTVDRERWEAVGRVLLSGLRSPLTTSVGRLFDAVSALCGLRARVVYEGQAAIELEMAAEAEAGPDFSVQGAGGRAAPPPAAVAARGQAGEGHPFPLVTLGEVRTVLDARPAIRAVLGDLERGVAAGRVASRFHEGLARATARACLAEAGRGGVETVVLSGGVFQNVRLLERTAALLTAEGCRVLAPGLLPPNDGGISYGQAAVAAGRG